MRCPFVTLVLAYAAFCMLYLGAAELPLGVPTTLSASPLDESIPRLPWTVWIYLSQFPFLGFVYWRAFGTVAWTRNLRGMLAATVVSVSVFVLWPTRIVRETVDADLATTLAFNALYGTDPATNCVPSLHVSLALLGVLGFWPERPRLAGACLGWATLIAVSTLTTKQHYLVDVVAGIVVAAGAAWLGRRVELAPLKVLNGALTWPPVPPTLRAPRRPRRSSAP
jgi:membrane-associated phospholipid phosphatase